MISRQKSAMSEVYKHTIYKTKAKKILLINKDEPSEDISRDRADQKERVIKREKELEVKDLIRQNKFIYLKISAILREVRLLSERASNLKISM